MTTIAYRDGVLAADTQLTLGDNVRSFCHKIYHLDEGRVLAAAGDADIIEQWKLFLLGKNKRPPKTMKGMEGIFIDKEDAYFFQDSPILMPIEKKFHAEGSGWQLAFAAMHMGLSAIKAVELAGEIDVNTNTLVDYYDVKTQELKEVSFET